MTSRSPTTIKSKKSKRPSNKRLTKKLPPLHPGEVLLKEFLKPLSISQYRLAKDVRVHPRRINEIVHGTRSITADTALRLSRYFSTSASFWMNLQARHDLEVQKDKLGDRLEREIPRPVASAR